LFTLFLPIKLYYSFEATAMVYPVREWHLKRGQDDSYISELQNFKTNVLSHRFDLSPQESNVPFRNKPIHPGKKLFLSPHR
jgi:hypothetical protein